MKTAFALFLIVFFQSGSISTVSRFAELRKNIIGCAPGDVFNAPAFEEISINDNREAAGKLINGVYNIEIEARRGSWYPESKEGTAIDVYAFAEKNKPLQLPGPMIRIPAGTQVHASITNSISEHALTVYGFYSRPGNASDSVVIAPGATSEITFKAGVPGTYFYRAVASDSIFQGLPWHDDSQLYGAFIVDPPQAKSDTSERVFVIGIWNDIEHGKYQGGEELVMNGLSWPYTESLNYTQRQKVKWRVINASNQVHPMHLHGFYYSIASQGKINEDNIYKTGFERKVVTELLHPGETMALQWVPELEGNWLFHCHTLVHIMPGSFLRHSPDMNADAMNKLETHAHDGMGGLIMGIHVSGDGKTHKQGNEAFKPQRRLSLVVGLHENYFDTLDGKGFMILEKGKPVASQYSIPGPPLILYKDRPTEINVVNHLKEPTTVHWHGLEIESYFDGVAGWGNKGAMLAPIVQPGDSFTVHITPPRAGTFIYHTHMHSLQLLQGMCGPIIVLEKGQKYDPETDKIFFISQGDEDFERRLFLLNGSNKTDTTHCKTMVNYRFRLTNITALGPTLNVSVLLNGKPANWKMIAKDGADLPLQQRILQPANKQTISIGETMDFNFRPLLAGQYVFELRGGAGKLFVTKVIDVK